MHPGIRVTDRDGVLWTGQLRARLQRLQRVQNHIRSLLGRVLPLQLPQLVQGSAHSLLNILTGTQHRREKTRHVVIKAKPLVLRADAADVCVSPSCLKANTGNVILALTGYIG